MTRMATGAGKDFVICGHRGMGENLMLGDQVVGEFRENTLSSFLQAAACGAGMVEFDIQVTRDGVPVVWHDDYIQYGNPSNPCMCQIKDLTSAEFRALGLLTKMKTSEQLSVVRKFKNVDKRGWQPFYSPWKCIKDDVFPTLEDLLTGLPVHLGLDIEIKMTESDDVPVTPPEEIDRVVDHILPVVEKTWSSGRTIIFSSFDPDVCVAVQNRQSAYPVYFLTTGGLHPHADPRRTSLQRGVDLCIEHGLAGIVCDTGALKNEQDIVFRAKQENLQVLTYGLLNNDPVWVLKQKELGVYCPIVDDVPGIVSALSSAVERVAVMSLSDPLVPPMVLEELAVGGLSNALVQPTTVRTNA